MLITKFFLLHRQANMGQNDLKAGNFLYKPLSLPREPVGRHIEIRRPRSENFVKNCYPQLLIDPAV
jgi:hypothetical protein